MIQTVADQPDFWTVCCQDAARKLEMILFSRSVRFSFCSVRTRSKAENFCWSNTSTNRASRTCTDQVLLTRYGAMNSASPARAHGALRRMESTGRQSRSIIRKIVAPAITARNMPTAFRSGSIMIIGSARAAAPRSRPGATMYMAIAPPKHTPTRWSMRMFLRPLPRTKTRSTPASEVATMATGRLQSRPCSSSASMDNVTMAWAKMVRPSE